MRQSTSTRKYYYIYKITNLINKKVYVGYRSSDIHPLEDIGYMGSGKIIKRAIAKNGLDNFDKQILKIFDNHDDAAQYEAFIVNENFISSSRTYNLVPGGRSPALTGPRNGFFGQKHSSETIKKIQASRTKTIESRGYVRVKGHLYFRGKHYYSAGAAMEDCNIRRTSFLKIMGNPKFTDSYYIDKDLQNYAENFFLDNLTRRVINRTKKAEETSLRFKGKPQSEESRRKKSIAQTGRTHHWQDKINKNPEKIRKTADFHRGRKRPLETGRKISEAARRRKEAGYIVYNRMIYITPRGRFINLNEAADVHGVSISTIRNRCVYRNKIMITANMIKNAKDKEDFPIGSTYYDLGWSAEKIIKNETE